MSLDIKKIDFLHFPIFISLFQDKVQTLMYPTDEIYISVLQYRSAFYRTSRIGLTFEPDHCK